MKKVTRREFENYDTSKQDIIVAVIFILVSMSLMLFWSHKTDVYVYETLSKPLIFEPIVLEGKSAPHKSNNFK